MVEIPVKANKNGKVDYFNIYDGNQRKIAGTFIATPKAPYFKEVKEIYKGLTILSIAHRESSLAYCDRIITLEDKE